MNNIRFLTKARIALRYRKIILNLLLAKIYKQKVFSFPILITDITHFEKIA